MILFILTHLLTKKRFKAPIGSPAEGAAFNDIWTDEELIKFKKEWHGEIAEIHEDLYQVIQAAGFIYDKSMSIYMMAMAIRLFEMHRILKPTGSIYLHCDPTASHYLKIIMDCLFGKQNFQNEIVWKRNQGSKNNTRTKYSACVDSILFYTKNSSYTFNTEFRDLSDATLANYKHIDDDGRIYRKNKKGRKTDKVYLDENPGTPVDTIWNENHMQLAPKTSERTGWPTQKPLSLLKRIIEASSNEGDIILDPFCGCATACVAAENFDRQWVGIDISESAELITKVRLQEEVDKQTELWNPFEDIHVSSTPSPKNRRYRYCCSETSTHCKIA